MIVPSDLRRAAIRHNGHTAEPADDMVSFAERERVIGAPEVETLQKRFL